MRPRSWSTRLISKIKTQKIYRKTTLTYKQNRHNTTYTINGLEINMMEIGDGTDNSNKMGEGQTLTVTRGGHITVIRGGR